MTAFNNGEFIFEDAAGDQFKLVINPRFKDEEDEEVVVCKVEEVDDDGDIVMWLTPEQAAATAHRLLDSIKELDPDFLTEHIKSERQHLNELEELLTEIGAIH